MGVESNNFALRNDFDKKDTYAGLNCEFPFAKISQFTKLKESQCMYSTYGSWIYLCI